jgi:hypothetical protein
MHIAGANTTGSQRAELTYRVLEEEWESGRGGKGEIWMEGESPPLPISLSPRLKDASLLEVRLLTGRKHQIRVQLSHAGFAILGDRKYGSTRAFPTGIALHSRRLVIEHPVSKMQLAVEAPLPAVWRRFVEVS